MHIAADMQIKAPHVIDTIINTYYIISHKIYLCDFNYK